MSEAAAGKPATGEKQTGVLEALERLPDEELHGVVKRCGEILDAREKERREEALKEIQKIAHEHGLNVNVKEAPAKRRKHAKTKK